MGTKAVGIVVGMLAVAGLPHESTERPMLVVRIVLLNEASVSGVVASRAQAEVARFYRSIDVDIVWVPQTAAVSPDLRYMRLTDWEPKDVRFSDALGMVPAEPGVRGVHGYVFWRRVQRLGRRLVFDAEAVLGALIAHEIGHMLLPEGSHSEAGVMLGAWSIAQYRMAAGGRLQFSSESARMIRHRLMTLGSAGVTRQRFGG
jgi:hypothetical protein